MKPFSTYPEDRQKMIDLCKVIEDPKTSIYNFDKAAIELADIVKAILEDEQVAIEASGEAA